MITYTLYLNDCYENDRLVPHDGITRITTNVADALSQARKARAISYRMVDSNGLTYSFARFEVN